MVTLLTQMLSNSECSKVQIFGEGNQNWKKNLSPTCLDVSEYINVKTSVIFFSNFVAFLKNLNFTALQGEHWQWILQERKPPLQASSPLLFRGEKSRLVCFMTDA